MFASHRFTPLLLAPLLLAFCTSFLLLAQSATAQILPSRADGPVTDDAELLDDETRARIAARLTALAEETGARVEVVTLINTALYTQGEDLDVYAGRLAEAFGLSEAPEGRHVLLLIFRDDRELRIEAGPGYGEVAEAEAGAIIAELIAPPFQAENYAAGIEAGVEGIAVRILGISVAEAPSGSAEGGAEEGGGALWWLLGLIAAPVGGIVWFNKRKAAKLAATPCPSCGKTGLTQSRNTLVAATTTMEGQGETRTTCPHCGYSTAAPYRIPRKSAPKPTAAAKSGPRKGGGASGGW